MQWVPKPAQALCFCWASTSYVSACAVTLRFISHLWSVQASIKERPPKSAALQGQSCKGYMEAIQRSSLELCVDLMDHHHHHHTLIQLCAVMLTVCLSSSSEVAAFTRCSSPCNGKDFTQIEVIIQAPCLWVTSHHSGSFSCIMLPRTAIFVSEKKYCIIWN